VSEHVLAESEVSMLKKRHTFAVTNKVPKMEIINAAVAVRSKLPPALGTEFCWRIRCMLEKSRPLTSNVSRKESMALRSLIYNKKIRILKDDKGNCVVRLNETTYKDKISSLLESGAYEILRKDPASQIERKIWKLIFKHKTIHTIDNVQNCDSYINTPS
jgi:hypothetical protein